MAPYAYPNHNLFEHLENTEKIASRTLDKMGKDVVCKRFKKYGLEIDHEMLEEAVRISSLLHDIGKADDRYQKNYLPLSFHLHEIPSAVISSRICEALRLAAVKDIVFMVVLQHMCAIRDWLSQTPTKLITTWRFNMYGDAVKEFICKHFNLTVDICVSYSDFETLRCAINDKISKNNKEAEGLKLYMLLLTPLSVGDNLDAYKARGGDLAADRRWFVEELISLEED
ncbi:MAG: HD domain-containing protein [Nitrososphaerales archaeon]